MTLPPRLAAIALLTVASIAPAVAQPVVPPPPPSSPEADAPMPPPPAPAPYSPAPPPQPYPPQPYPPQPYPPQPYAQPPGYAPAPAPALLPASEAGVLGDANSGRVWAMPTALMSPAGSWTFSDYELFFIGASYAPTDNLAISVVTLIPLGFEGVAAMGTIKARFVRTPRLHVAGQLVGFGFAGEGESWGAGSIGGVATYCISLDCASHISGSITAGIFDDAGANVPLVGSVGLVNALGRRVKLVLEVDTAGILGDINEVSAGALGWYGLRFTSRNIGVDFGLVRPIADGWDPDFFPLGFPWLNFQYRGLPGD